MRAAAPAVPLLDHGVKGAWCRSDKGAGCIQKTKESSVQLENIATPQEDQTPELRYASLHRAVERGMASDEVLRDLVEICLQLGHVDEALRVHASMKPGAMCELVTS